MELRIDNLPKNSLHLEADKVRNTRGESAIIDVLLWPVTKIGIQRLIINRLIENIETIYEDSIDLTKQTT